MLRAIYLLLENVLAPKSAAHLRRFFVFAALTLITAANISLLEMCLTAQQWRHPGYAHGMCKWKSDLEVLEGNGCAQRPREGRPGSEERAERSWLGKWRPAAVQRHLNERKKSDVSSSPRTVLQNTLRNAQKHFHATCLLQDTYGSAAIKLTFSPHISSFINLKSKLLLVSACCFPQTSAPQQQLMTSCRNFLKEKQVDDIRVSGENIINNKQQWNRQLHESR